MMNKRPNATKADKNQYISGKPLSKEFLKQRGYCCGLKCLNCPYYPRHIRGTKTLLNPL
jgi:hypothetical protein